MSAQRLYIRIYKALVGALVVSLLAGVLAGVLFVPHPRFPPDVDAAVDALLAEQVPSAQAEQQLKALALQHDLKVGVYAADKSILMQTDAQVPSPRRSGNHFVHKGRGAGVAIARPQGGWVVLAHGRPAPGTMLVRLAGALVLIALALAAAAWPLARNLSGRLERLREAVVGFGDGELARRVQVEGVDEVADVARAFNATADRVQALVQEQRRVLAYASHELRSPLARIRMAAALWPTAEPASAAELAQQVDQDVTALDELIEQLLLSGRLVTGTLPADAPQVDMAALVRAHVSGLPTPEAVQVQGELFVAGDDLLLRRLASNLIDNALHHGLPPVTVQLSPGGMRVSDCGEGVPQALREQIFEPFQQGVDAAQGVGLGLALVRRIAGYHGATVTCGEGPEGGAAFVVCWEGRTP